LIDGLSQNHFVLSPNSSLAGSKPLSFRREFYFFNPWVIACFARRQYVVLVTLFPSQFPQKTDLSDEHQKTALEQKTRANQEDRSF
jgi:hypothetical protein